MDIKSIIAVDNIVKLILLCRHRSVTDIDKNYNKIREYIRYFYIEKMDISIIITTMTSMLINAINDETISTRIIQLAYDAKYGLFYGRRDMTHIEYFIFGVIAELHKTL